MKINRLKVDQEVWYHNGEFPVKGKVEEIDIENNEVWVDSNPYEPEELHSTEYKCKQAN